VKISPLLATPIQSELLAQATALGTVEPVVIVQDDAPAAGSVLVHISPEAVAMQKLALEQVHSFGPVELARVEVTHLAAPPVGSVEVITLRPLKPMHKVVVGQDR
jgi:hypothetical protein